MFTYVMNRKINIVNNLDSWLKNNFGEIIILDWVSDEKLYDIISEKKDSRVKYYRVENEQFFIRTFAQNLAFRLAKFNKVLKLDSDIILTDDFLDKNQISEKTFISGNWYAARNDNEKHTHGNIFVHLNDFYRINGYNEFVKTYGWEDSDFMTRLIQSGCNHKLINMDTIYHVPHAETSRKANMLVYNSNVETEKYKYCISHMLPWGVHCTLQNYNFTKINDQYIEINRIKGDETDFDPELLKSAEEYAVNLVATWFIKGVNLNTMSFDEKKRRLSHV